MLAILTTSSPSPTLISAEPVSVPIETLSEPSVAEIDTYATVAPPTVTALSPEPRPINAEPAAPMLTKLTTSSPSPTLITAEPLSNFVTLTVSPSLPVSTFKVPL